MSGVTIRRKTITVLECKCLHCGHAWIPRGQQPPSRCAKCKATGWNRKPLWRWPKRK